MGEKATNVERYVHRQRDRISTLEAELAAEKEKWSPAFLMELREENTQLREALEKIVYETCGDSYAKVIEIAKQALEQLHD